MNSATEKATMQNVKARRDYMTVQRDPSVPSERVRVTGFQQVRVGFGDSERVEQWCRVRFHSDGARLLMHPSALQSVCDKCGMAIANEWHFCPPSEWKVTDPARVAAGYHGITWHSTKREAEARAAMFPGSVVERVSNG